MIKKGILAVLTLLLLAGCRHEREKPIPEYQKGKQAPTDIEETMELLPELPGVEVGEDLSLEEETKMYLLRYARALCDKDDAKASSLEAPPEAQAVKAPILGVYYDPDGTRREGLKVADTEKNLKEKIEVLAPKLCQTGSHGYLHLLVVSYVGSFPNFGNTGFFDRKAYEPQVTGMIWEREGKIAEIDPLMALEDNRGRDGSRAYLSRKLGISDGASHNDDKIKMQIYRTIHFGERFPDRQFGNFFRGHEVLRAEDVDHALVEQRLRLIGRWFAENTKGGQITYEYDVKRGKYHNEKRTMVRSTMSTWVFNRLAYYLDDDALKKKALEPLEYYLEEYFTMGQSKAAGRLIPSTTPLPKGDLVSNRYTSAGFICAAILERDDWSRRETECRLLVDWAMGKRKDDGFMWTQWGQSQFFMPGQLLLAAAYLHEKTKDEKYKKFFESLWSTYEKPLLDFMHLARKNAIPYAPAWYTQPLAAMWLQDKKDSYREMIYHINDRVALYYEDCAERQSYWDYDGALAPTETHYGNNSVTSAALESLVDAAIVAKLDSDERRYLTYTEIIRHAVAYLLRLQWTEANTYYIEDRERVIGGLKRDLVDTRMWMDSVWHFTSALTKIQRHKLLERFEGEKNLPPAKPDLGTSAR